MKIIISHDVDHITAWEHKTNLIIPKFVIRCLIEFKLGYVSTFEIMNRFKRLVRNKWHNLEELMRCDKENGVASTFFVAVSQGNGIAYSQENSRLWIKRILREGFDVGVHGIAHNNYDEVKLEYDLFERMSGLSQFGIRVHNLRHCEDTFKLFEKARYVFDSSVYAMKKPYKVGNLWEFPLHIMDAYVIRYGKKWQNQTLDQAKETTKREIDDACRQGISYLTVLSHDRYFGDEFRTWREWYVWLIEYFVASGLQFISNTNAIEELEAN